MDDLVEEGQSRCLHLEGNRYFIYFASGIVHLWMTKGERGFTKAHTFMVGKETINHQDFSWDKNVLVIMGRYFIF